MEQQVLKLWQVMMLRSFTLNCTAAVLRAKECVMNTVTTVQENAEDIYEGAKQINEERAEAKAAAEFAEEAEAEEETEEETTEEVGAEAVEEAAE